VLSRGADLFECTAAENIGAMILGVAIAVSSGDTDWILFPLVIRAFGLIATAIGLLSVPFFTKEGQDAMTPLNRGYFLITALSVAFMALVTNLMMGDKWGWFFACGVVGIATSVVFVYITQYYTSGSWRPVKEIADASRTGPATNIITGTAVGLETTASTAIAIGSAIVISFILGEHSDLPNGGVFGTAVATMGMLMSAAYILAMDTFGRLRTTQRHYRDGRASRRHGHHRRHGRGGQHDESPHRGYAMASAGLAAFLLFSAFWTRCGHFTEDESSVFCQSRWKNTFPGRHIRCAPFVAGLLA
jgi:K(+)-stimulated pyrophosphate-energized sodium pump